MMERETATYKRWRPTAPREASPAARARLIFCLAVYGGALGAAALVVNFISRTPYPQVPAHMETPATAIFSLWAFLVCGALGAMFARWLGGAFENSAVYRALKWIIGVGFGFGILSPVITGAVIPMSRAFIDAYYGALAPLEIPMSALDALFQAPRFAFHHGVFGLFTGMTAGALFGAGAWAVNELNRRDSESLAKYGGVVLALLLSAVFYGVAVLAPATSLERWG